MAVLVSARRSPRSTVRAPIATISTAVTKPASVPTQRTDTSLHGCSGHKSGVWPRDGEIDFSEGDLQGSIGAFMHRQNGTSGGDQDGYRTSARFTDWHTAVVEWKPNFCRFILDGTIVGTSTSRVPTLRCTGCSSLRRRSTARIRPHQRLRTCRSTTSRYGSTYRERGRSSARERRRHPASNA
jgi:hypothetical protein